MAKWMERYAVWADRPSSPGSADDAVTMTTDGDGTAVFRFRDRQSAEAFAARNTYFGKACAVVAT